VANGAMTLVETEEDAENIAVADPGNLAFLTQTTLSVDDTAEIVSILQRRFPAIVGPKGEDICYATSNRQAAVKAIAKSCDLVLVIGAPNSSNSLRLVEVAERAGTPARLVQRAEEIDFSWLDGVATLGITAGASAPEVLVRQFIARISERYDVREEQVVTAEESITFKLPRELTAAADAA
jgi:4-hydroxy-3-methylbut-2-en-1-yl diphosphate reductase